MSPSYVAAGILIGALVTTYTLADVHAFQKDDPFYLDIEVNVTGYERAGYADFDLVRISLDIANVGVGSLIRPTFMLGGNSIAPDGSISPLKAEYAPVSATYVQNLNVPISLNGCTFGDQWGNIAASSTGSVLLCFVVEKSFFPNGVLVRGEIGHGVEGGSCYSSDSRKYFGRTHYNADHPVCATHVVPLQNDSTYCDRHSKYCDQKNVQIIPEWVVVKALASAPNGDPLGQGTLFLASATIMAFAVFGSALGMRIRRKPKNKNKSKNRSKDVSRRAKVYNFISIVVLILVQALFMIYLIGSSGVRSPWQFDYWLVAIWIFATAVFLFLITFFVTIGKSYRADEETGTGQLTQM